MKTVALISFTKNGSEVAKKVGAILKNRRDTVTLAKKYKGAKDSIEESLSEWTKEQFQKQDALIFIGAMGIAVRAVAPYVASKTKDPAVLVIDEQGKYCIPVLSGHIGGANELAELISERIGALAVITTATDLNKKWAVDVFAAKNGLKILDMKKAKEISARLLAGEKISVYIEESCCEIKGQMPKGVQLWTGKDAPDIVIGIRNHPLWKEALYLIPQTVVLGIGCRKGIEENRIEEKVFQALKEADIYFESVSKTASIELKKEEAGMLEFCKKYRLDFEVFDAETLKKAEGEFTSSGFVKETTGVDNVCERSAVCGSHGGEIIIAKQAKDGVTVAAAVQKRSVRFE